MSWWGRWNSTNSRFVQQPADDAASCVARVVVLLVLSGTVVGCAARRIPQGDSGPWEGMASWYGVDFHGRRAADGSRYNMYEFTAAHLTLPFGTEVVVTNLENGRRVKVKITDRGPFVEGRIIDLSFAAAQEIDMLRAGVARVRLELAR